jgi:hypothetical protein
MSGRVSTNVDLVDRTTCCDALQDRVWVTSPGDEQWEVYTVRADAGATTPACCAG